MTEDGLNQDDGSNNIAWSSLWLPALLASVTLWAVCIVAEERFLPCLTAVCDAFGIPAAVAGPTLLSMGSASPNLLAVLMSVLVTHSSLGLGTIVGSNMFQLLAVLAAAVHASRNGQQIRLAPSTTLRELLFYALAVGLLCHCLTADVQQDAIDDDDDVVLPTTIYIHRGHSVLLLMTYVLYVLVCANFEPILAWFMIRPYGEKLSTTQEDDLAPVTAYLEHEPSGNFGSSPETILQEEEKQQIEEGIVRDDNYYNVMASQENQNTDGDDDSDVDSQGLEVSLSEDSKQHDNDRHRRGWQRVSYMGKRVLWSSWTLEKHQEPGLEDIVEITSTSGNGGNDSNITSLSCHLWQLPHRFYHQVPLVARHNDWQKRWFTFAADGTVSSIARNNRKKQTSRSDH